MSVSESAEKFYRRVTQLLSDNSIHVENVNEIFKLEPHYQLFSELIGKISKVANDYKLCNAWKCIAADMNVEESINELYNYTSNAERAFYISNAFKKIILSNSNIASSVIAYIIGEISKAKREFTQVDVILFEALSVMTDFDVKIFVDIMDNLYGCELLGKDFVNASKIDISKYASYYSTLRLCDKTRIFELKTFVITEDAFNNGEFYKITETAVTLREYLNKTKQILQYQW